jgi:prepilin-type N-terminal cleavage/methylation domain-containing protein
MAKPRSLRRGPQGGFTLLECVVAILVINLTIAGLLQLLRGQDQQLTLARVQLEMKEVVRLHPHPDPMARVLGMPALRDQELVATEDAKLRGPYEVKVVDWWRGVEPGRFRVVFEQTLVEARP